MYRRISTIVVLFALALVLAAVAGCAADGGDADGRTDQVVPADESEGDGAGDAAESPDGDALVGERCTPCHSRTRIDSAVKTRDEWEVTVDRMVRNGANLSEDERDLVIEYLSTR